MRRPTHSGAVARGLALALGLALLAAMLAPPASRALDVNGQLEDHALQARFGRHAPAHRA